MTSGQRIQIDSLRLCPYLAILLPSSQLPLSLLWPRQKLLQCMQNDLKNTTSDLPWWLPMDWYLASSESASSWEWQPLTSEWIALIAMLMLDQTLKTSSKLPLNWLHGFTWHSSLANSKDHCLLRWEELLTLITTRVGVITTIYLVNWSSHTLEHVSILEVFSHYGVSWMPW